MSHFFNHLERDLVDAARRQSSKAAPRRRTRLSLALAAALLLATCATAAGATYLVLRASPIAPFADRDLTPEQRVAAGSSRVLDLRAADPDGHRPPWALRVARSRSGLLCGAVGQVADGTEFGIVGLDQRFRAVPEANADACGQEDPDGVSLLGTRVFAADGDRDVRTVVNGLAGARLERVTVAERGGVPRELPRSPEGAFLLALRGYPEDAQPVVALRWTGGRTARYALAASPFLAPDPLAGGAWRIEAFTGGAGGSRVVRRRSGRRVRVPRFSCVSFRTARQERRHVVSPQLCGRADYSPGPDRTLYFGSRRLSGRPARYSPERGYRNAHPPRTALWGEVGPRLVREVEVSAPGERRVVTPAPSGGFLAVFDPRVDPASLRVEVRYRSGRVVRYGASHGLDRTEELQ